MHFCSNTKSLESAFTLAETLITIGIIGVVSALTLPNLVQHFKKVRTVNQLKESYSILQQAIKLSENDNGEVESWDRNLSGYDFFHKYLANYLKYTNEYDANTLIRKVGKYKLLNGNDYIGTTYTNTRGTYHFTLLNGSQITTNHSDGYVDQIWIGIDANGISKPNQIGIDTFLFMLSSKGLHPLGGPGTGDRETYNNYSRDFVKGTQNNLACNKMKYGYWCSALIINDGWKISDDYPWSGK